MSLWLQKVSLKHFLPCVKSNKWMLKSAVHPLTAATVENQMEDSSSWRSVLAIPPPTALPETVPGASREKHEVCQLDFWHLRGIATRERVSSGVWHRVGRFLVDIYLQLRSLLGATWINAYSMSYIKCLTEFGWTRWVLVHSEWFIAYNSFSESRMIETFCFSECLREEAWSMTASWGWSSRKQRCAGTSSSCFKKLLKKQTCFSVSSDPYLRRWEIFLVFGVGTLVPASHSRYCRSMGCLQQMCNGKLGYFLCLVKSFQIWRQRIFKPDTSHFPSTIRTFPSFFKCSSFCKSLWRTIQ